MSLADRLQSTRLSRRRLLTAGATAAGLLVAGPGRARAQTTAPNQRVTVIGRSQGGQPIVVFHVGSGKRRVLLIGGQHGSPEANAVDVVDALRGYFTEHEREIPKGLGLDIITVANPDGYILGSRQYLSGVDPNRNWPSTDWDTDAYDSLGRYFYGLGGPAPMSEPETRHLVRWIERRRPVLVVNYHSAGGFISTHQDGLSYDLSEAYATAGRYPFYSLEDGPFGYPISGAMDAWLSEVGIPDIFVELSTLDDPEIEDNLAGVHAVLSALA